MFRHFIGKIQKNERGSIAAVVAVALVAMLGCTALAVDLGRLHKTQLELQNAADAAASAGALHLLHASEAVIIGKQYAAKNGVPEENTTITTPYDGDAYLIEAVCEKKVSFLFAPVLGINDQTVTARSVARFHSIWDGEAMPFLNLDDDYTQDSRIEAWEKTGPGDFESIWKTDFTMYNLGKNDDHSLGWIWVDYHDGITITKGTVANVKQEIGYLYQQHRPLYIFSLSSDVIQSGKYSRLKNLDVIPLEDLVLLQVTFDDYDMSGKTLYLTVHEAYDINSGEAPVDFLYDMTHGNARLVE